MLTYATASTLKGLTKASVIHAEPDDWLEEWTVRHLQTVFASSWPSKILDIEIGLGNRHYRDTARAAGSTIFSSTSNELTSISGQFDLVLALSFLRNECLASIEPENAYSTMESMVAAAKFLAPGGVLVWSYLYAFADDDFAIHNLLEPAAVYRSLILRGLKPVKGDGTPAGKIQIYQDPDTLFVNQRAVLCYSARHRRIARVFGTVQRPTTPSPEISQPSSPSSRQRSSWWRGRSARH
jgi:hypothetical protein